MKNRRKTQPLLTGLKQHIHGGGHVAGRGRAIRGLHGETACEQSIGSASSRKAGTGERWDHNQVRPGGGAARLGSGQFLFIVL
jgi:hypothetical protein